MKKVLFRKDKNWLKTIPNGKGLFLALEISGFSGARFVRVRG
jgi:hypothetical protein